MADVASAVSSASNVVGRYFSIVSALPSLLFVTYVTLLVRTGAWSHEPNWAEAFAAMMDLSLGTIGFLVLLSLALGIVLHPLQFTAVQSLEGYWGIGRWAQAIRGALVERHVRRRQALWDLRFAAADQRKAATDDKARHLSREAIRWRSIEAEADRLYRRYPVTPDLVMPTSLGNMLRRYEVGPGEPYGIDIPATAPLLAMVAPPEHMAYVNDQRSSLDLAVRTCLLSAAATVVSFLFLWDDGLWLLLALAPYLACWLAYRGSVVAAEHYGIGLATLVTLNRFTLYEHLRFEPPRTLHEEVALNELIMPIVAQFGDPGRPVRYTANRPRRDLSGRSRRAE